mmetsp:Transcript_6808/g.19908  ORF Transcript_6808/g.19908 Transcript_6808/m.19908 type:complete len:200 (+) Transcript_6808:165-764(+)
MTTSFEVVVTDIKTSSSDSSQKRVLRTLLYPVVVMTRWGPSQDETSSTLVPKGSVLWTGTFSSKTSVPPLLLFLKSVKATASLPWRSMIIASRVYWRTAKGLMKREMPRSRMRSSMPTASETSQDPLSAAAASPRRAETAAEPGGSAAGARETGDRVAPAAPDFTLRLGALGPPRSRPVTPASVPCNLAASSVLSRVVI